MTNNIKKNKEGLFNKKKEHLKSQVSKTNETEETEKYIPLTGTLPKNPVTGNILFDGLHKITGLPEAKADNEVVNWQQVKNLIKEETEKKFISKDHPIIEGSLNLKSGSILGVQSAEQATDAVPLSQLTKLANSLVLKSGNSSKKPLMTSLNFDEKYTIKNIADPSEAGDCVNFKTLKIFIAKQTSGYLSIEGGQVDTDFKISNHNITNLGDPVEAEDVLNLKTLNKILDRYVSFSGTSENDPLQGDRFLQDGKKISGLRDPKAHSDAMTPNFALNFLNQQKQDFLRNSDNIFLGNLNMNSFRITDVKEGSSDSEGVTLKQAIEKLPTLVPLSGTEIALDFPLLFNAYSTLKNFGNASSSNELVSKKVFKQLCEKFFADEIVRKDNPQIIVDLNLKGKECRNLGSSSSKDSLVSLRQLNKFIDKELSVYSQIKGFSLRNNLKMNNHKIVALGDPSGDTNLINLRTLKNILFDESSALLKKMGGIFKTMINANGNMVNNLGDPEKDDELVNLRTLKSTIANKFPLDKDIRFQGNLVFDGNHTISGFKNAETDDEVINLKSLNELLKDHVANNAQEFSRNLVFNGNSKIRGTASPIHDDNAVNLKNLKRILSNAFNSGLPSTGGVLKASLNVNGNRIRCLGIPSKDTDAVNQKYFSQQINNYLSPKGNTTTTPIIGNFSFKQGFRIQNLPKASENQELVTEHNLNEVREGLIENIDRGPAYIQTNISLKPSGKIMNLPTPKNDYDPVTRNFLEGYITESLSKISFPQIINMEGNAVINVGDPIYSSDVVNLNTLEQYKENYLEPEGSSLEHPILSSLIFNGTNTLAFSCEEKSDEDAVNLKMLGESLKDAIPKERTDKIKLQGNLVFDKKTTLTNLGSPENKEDLIDSKTTNTVLNEVFSDFLTLTGGMLDNELNMQEQTISGIKFHPDIMQAPENEALSLQTLQNYCQKHLINRSSSNEVSILENLIFDGAHTIYGLEAASLPGGGVTIEQAQKHFDNELKVKGTDEKSPFDSNLLLNGTARIVNHKAPQNDDEPVTLQFATENVEALKQNEAFVNTQGGKPGYEWDMNGFLLLNLPNPEHPEDIVNNKFINESLQNFINLNNPMKPLNSGISFQDIHTVRNIGDPTLPGDGVNLKTLKKHINLLSKNFISKTHPVLSVPVTPLSGTVTNLTLATQEKDAVSYKKMKLESLNLIAKQGNTESTPIQGNWLFDDNHTITSLGNPENDQELVNLQTAKAMILDSSVNYASQVNPHIQGNLNLNGQRMENLKNPEQDNEVVNFRSLLQEISNYKAENLMATKGENIVQGMLNLSNHKLQFIKTEATNHVVNLKTLSQLFDDQKRSRISCEGDNIISGTLDIQDNPIENIKDAEAPEDVVNLRTLTKKINESKTHLFDLSSDSLLGSLDLNMQNITELGEGIKATDLVNLDVLRKIENSKVSFLNSSVQNFTGDIILDGDSKCTGFAEGVDDYDAVTLGQGTRYIQSMLSDYLKVSDMNMNADLDMNGKTISNIADPIDLTDALNHNFLKDHFLQYQLNNGSDIELTTNLYFENGFKIQQNIEPEDENDAVNLKTAKQYLSNSTKNHLSLKGDTISLLDAGQNEIHNLKTPEKPDEVINLKKLTDDLLALSSAYVSLSDNSFNTEINLGGHSLLTLGNPESDHDAVNIHTLNSLLSDYVHYDDINPQIDHLTFDGSSTLRVSTTKSQESGVPLKYFTTTLNEFLMQNKISKDASLDSILTELHMETHRIKHVVQSENLSSVVPLSKETLLIKEMPHISIQRDATTHVWEPESYINWGSLPVANSSSWMELSEDATGIRFLIKGLYLIKTSLKLTQSPTYAQLIQRSALKETVISGFLCPQNETLTIQALIPILKNSDETILQLKNTHKDPCVYESLNLEIQRISDIHG